MAVRDGVLNLVAWIRRLASPSPLVNFQNLLRLSHRSPSTDKDKLDIVLSFSADDLKVGEAKSSKYGEFSKYSTTSRQVKSYVSRCEGQGKRVQQVLIVVPGFSQDFIEAALNRFMIEFEDRLTEYL